MTVFSQLFKHPLTTLLFRYGIVGVVASVVHFSIAYLFFDVFEVNYLFAHFFGFSFGLLTAYSGHYFYSFKDSAQHSKRFPKFFITSLFALTLHQSGAYFLVSFLQLDYSTRVLPLLIVSVPLFTFLLNKFWVFSVDDKST
jgi:putative flippase GtrA